MYQEIAEEINVQVKIPKIGQYMKWVQSHQVNKNLIKAHWKNGLLIAEATKSIIVNRHFYDITNEDCGKKRTFRVRVLEKTTKQGKKFKLIDFHKISGKPTKKIIFSNNGKEGILINHTNTKIVFEKL